MTKLERFESVMKELAEEPFPVIVEGKNDKKAMETFGVKNAVLIHTGTLQKLAETTTSKKVILITDYDRRGEILKKTLSELFKNEGITVDHEYRKRIRRLTGFITVEELPSKYEELAKSELKNR
ncbi:toprim domain-containing protein [Candidatus Micrarchaeota archaeon]|nr:toprim domain-containing protein [Candidatus Micrarchaeota archaeon]